MLSRYLFTMVTVSAMAALPQPLNAQLIGDVTVTTSSHIISDGVSFTNAKSIPSAVIDYTTQVANRSVLPQLPDALFVTNPVPPQLILYVGDMAGPGSGPVVFAQGTRSSQLACTFGGIADGTELYIYREDKKIGKVRAVEVRDKIAACDIAELYDPWLAVRINDAVAQ